MLHGMKYRSAPVRFSLYVGLIPVSDTKDHSKSRAVEKPRNAIRRPMTLFLTAVIYRERYIVVTSPGQASCLYN